MDLFPLLAGLVKRDYSLSPAVGINGLSSPLDVHCDRVSGGRGVGIRVQGCRQKNSLPVGRLFFVGTEADPAQYRTIETN